MGKGEQEDVAGQLGINGKINLLVYMRRENACLLIGMDWRLMISLFKSVRIAGWTKAIMAPSCSQPRLHPLTVQGVRRIVGVSST